MLHQLQLLEQAILDIKTRYHQATDELARLKQAQGGAVQDEQTQKQLEQALQEIEGLNTSIYELTLNRAKLEEEIDELTEANLRLLDENKTLSDKYNTAIERTKALQTWLTSIDNQSL